MHTSLRIHRLIGLAIIALLVPPAARGQEVAHQPNKPLLDLGFKFEGAQGCANAQCHGAAAPKAGDAPMTNEYTTWSTKDKHAKAWRSLLKNFKNAETGTSTEEIAKALKIDNPANDARCTNCHTLTVPAAQQFKDAAGATKYNVREGVTCGGCHGPYEKWEQPHNQPGGANKLRQAAGYAGLDAKTLEYNKESAPHAKLLKEVGLFDTRPIVARAQICASCHLKIDATLVAAGHPQPQFELASYSKMEPPHWREPGGYWGTKVWAAGQAVCLIEACGQLAERAAAGDEGVKEAAEQAMGHYRSFKAALGAASAKTLDEPAAKLADAVGKKDKAAIAAGTKALADATKALLPKVGALKIDGDNAQKLTAKVLSKLANESAAAKDGVYAAFQLQKSLSAVYTTFAEQAKPGDAAGVKEMIDKKLLDTMYAETWKPDDYNKVLGEIAAKLPADAAGGPDAID